MFAVFPISCNAFEGIIAFSSLSCHFLIVALLSFYTLPPPGLPAAHAGHQEERGGQPQNITQEAKAGGEIVIIITELGKTATAAITDCGTFLESPNHFA